jgi:hypothetical protein
MGGRSGEGNRRDALSDLPMVTIGINESWFKFRFYRTGVTMIEGGEHGSSDC